MLNRYEGMIIVDNAIVMNDWDNFVTHVKDVQAKHNTEIIDIQKWGEKKLAYKIGDHTRGTYVLVRFNAPGSSVLALRKEYELSDKVIRILIVRDDKPERNITLSIDDSAAAKESVGNGNSDEPPGEVKTEVVNNEVVSDLKVESEDKISE